MKSQDEQWLLKEKYDGRESEAFEVDCERLACGEPLGYVIGWVPFLDCKICLDSHPLIPRAETEFWVERAIAEITQTKHVKGGLTSFDKPGVDGIIRILDLCAGSGAIGVAVKKAVPDTHVTFAEIDHAHLPTIEKNLAENLKTQYYDQMEHVVIESDLFDALDPEAQYDYILSNPPYIDPALDRAEQSVKKYEPREALYGGESGLALITRIIADAPAHLAPRGVLYLEHEPEQASAIHCLGARVGFAAQTFTDQYGVARYTRLQRSP